MSFDAWSLLLKGVGWQKDEDERTIDAMVVQGRASLQVQSEVWGAGAHSASSSLGPGSGSINVDELRIVLQSCLRESAISLPEEKQDQLTLALFKLANKDCSGVITFDELRDELQRFPGVMENLTIRYRPVSCRGTASAGIRHQVRSVA